MAPGSLTNPLVTSGHEGNLGNTSRCSVGTAMPRILLRKAKGMVAVQGLPLQPLCGRRDLGNGAGTATKTRSQSSAPPVALPHLTAYAMLHP